MCAPPLIRNPIYLISLKRLDEVKYLDLDHIFIKVDELNELFERYKSEIKSNITRQVRSLKIVQV